MYPNKDAFVVLTKWPTFGKSKTRLAKTIGNDVALQFVFACLLDLLKLFDKLPNNIQKFICYAPTKCKDKLETFLNDNGLSGYTLLPMVNQNLLTSNLGDKLNGMIKDLQHKYSINGCISVIGSDCIELKMEYIMDGFNVCRNVNDKNDYRNIHIIKAVDGGYVSICLPPNYNGNIFYNIRWSTENTCSDQIKQIQLCQYNAVTHNKILNDVDEINEYITLYNDFGIQYNNNCIINKDNNTKFYINTFPNVYKVLKGSRYQRKSLVLIDLLIKILEK